MPAPDYPEKARSAGLNGTVRVRVTVSKDNKVSVDDLFDDQICAHINDTRWNDLRKSAKRAAKMATVESAKLDGKLVESVLFLIYKFGDSREATNSPVIVEFPNLNKKAISLPAPVASRQFSGPVQVSVVIDVKGNVESAGAISGHPMLKTPAVKAACGAKFSPLSENGTIMMSTGIITYNFVR